ncbi:hypothetical protein KP79_PYT21807 [Mizuhopecten yessoensis]|uniref:Uncharacterized protein n=1 Tax=Mizuhopecten yessoensis TaxID=6573 RepID=A0A210Q3U6_MIZYE|nr:hypothetical protein KP79_PYT21807 [Mizuhopecten yessoensis]
MMCEMPRLFLLQRRRRLLQRRHRRRQQQRQLNRRRKDTADEYTLFTRNNLMNARMVYQK